MSVRRAKYYCPVELTMDIIGGKWTVVILAHLKEGDHRYGELRRKMPDITEKMLTQRLKELTEAGLIKRTEHDGVTYSLIADDLRPVLQALYDWGTNRAASAGIEILSP